MNENVWISIKSSLNLVFDGLINNITALVQIMSWRRSGGKPLSVLMMAKITDAYIRQSVSMGFWDMRRHNQAVMAHVEYKSYFNDPMYTFRKVLLSFNAEWSHKD